MTRNKKNFIKQSSIQVKSNTFVSPLYENFAQAQEKRAQFMSEIEFEPTHLYMLPLGGVGEIGMNCMMYQYDGRWIMVDCGNSFDRLYSNHAHVVVPCLEFAKQRLDIFDGILITHGHEDHIGALPYLWKQLKCPIYSTKFTNLLIKRKFEELNLPTDQIIDIECAGEQSCNWYDIGTFKVQWIDVCHSIPGAAMIALRTHHGSILHTGDWKIDDQPLLNERTDFASLAKLAKEDLYAILSDSTNIMLDGVNPTEEEVGLSLIKEITSVQHGKIFVTFFSTNISRLYSCIQAAKEAGRKVAILGRALQRSYTAAITAGYLEQEPHVLLEGFESIPSDKLLIACSGSQGEERSALARIARGEHRQIKINAGDTVFFSCRLIPTNAKEVVELENNLMKRGVNVITNADALIHSSGHAKKAEFERFYKFIQENVKTNRAKPVALIPVHGTTMFLKKHALFVKKYGLTSLNKDQLFNDGYLYKLAPEIKFVCDIGHKVQFVDAGQVVSTDSPLVQERHGLHHGFISIALGLTHGMNLSSVHVSSYAVIEDKNWLEFELKKLIVNLFNTTDFGNIRTSLNYMIKSKVTDFLVRNFDRDKRSYIDLHIVNTYQQKRL